MLHPSNSTEDPFEEERQFTAKVRKMLASQNQNPGRLGCDLFRADIKALAWHKELRNDLQPVLEHVLHCSPCFNDHRRHKRQFKVYRRSLKIGLPAVAALLVLSCALSLLWVSKGRLASENSQRPTAALDLNLGVRGVGQSSDRPLELNRDHEGPMVIELPKGSRAGKYMVRLGLLDRPLVEREGLAVIDQQGSTILRFSHFGLSGIPPGNYDLAITRPPLDWVHFSVRVR